MTTHNAALVSMITKDFMPGFRVFITSLLNTNPWFNLPLVLIDIDLSEKERSICRKYYNNIIFKAPRKELYKQVNWNKTQPHLRNTYYTLDIFSYDEYERAVFIDLDVLFLKDIRYLFVHKMKNPIAGVSAYTRKEDSLDGYINAGVMVVDIEKLPPRFYYNIVYFASRGFRFPEQDAINKFMHNKIDYLPKCYNVEKRMLLSRNYVFDLYEVAILHYVALKPWQKRAQTKMQRRDREDFRELEKLWWEYYPEGKKV